MIRSKHAAQFLREQREAKQKVTGINPKTHLPSRNEVANAEGPKGPDVNKKDQKGPTRDELESKGDVPDGETSSDESESDREAAAAAVSMDTIKAMFSSDSSEVDSSEDRHRLQIMLDESTYNDDSKKDTDKGDDASVSVNDETVTTAADLAATAADLESNAADVGSDGKNAEASDVTASAALGAAKGPIGPKGPTDPNACADEMTGIRVPPTVPNGDCLTEPTPGKRLPRCQYPVRSSHYDPTNAVYERVETHPAASASASASAAATAPAEKPPAKDKKELTANGFYDNIPYYMGPGTYCWSFWSF